ncbi:MAG TPA: nuclear transport factor 2 family protein [Solirubrobacteraceae bacterium]|nr:nuclear transport factor 2 family protein [Solirubrobacteraceae bacterium]
MSDAARSPLALRTALEEGDVEAAVACFAADAVLRSPLTDALAFRGHDEIRTVTEIVLASFQERSYGEVVAAGPTAFIAWSALVGGRSIEVVDRLELDGDGRIRELSVFCRPLPAATAALRVVGTALARRNGRARAALVSAATFPLATLAGAGDAVGLELVRPALR